MIGSVKCVCEVQVGVMEVKYILTSHILLRSNRSQRNAERVLLIWTWLGGRGGQRDFALTLGKTETVSEAVWSDLIKAGAASVTVAQSWPQENTQSHSSLGGLSVWMHDGGPCCCRGEKTNAWFCVSGDKCEFFLKLTSDNTSEMTATLEQWPVKSTDLSKHLTWKCTNTN